MITTAMLTVASLCFLVMKLNPRIIKKMVRAGFTTDLMVHIGFVVLFGITGTISGMMTGLVAALFVSILLWVARFFIKDEPKQTRKTPGLGPWNATLLWLDRISAGKRR